ncbi:hypothetical protein MKX01_029736 [Papaver californicum]|nr:hypothetical protein MKX01_029736 [Papaver californicum]
MKTFSSHSLVLVVLVLTTMICIKPPPGKCKKGFNSDCCKPGEFYTTYKCSPTDRRAVLTTNSFEKGGDGGGPSESLSTGWYNNGNRCLHNITIKGNERSVVAKVDHDYQPPCPHNIVDASPAVWKALGIPRENWGDLDITWSDA